MSSLQKEKKKGHSICYVNLLIPSAPQASPKITDLWNRKIPAAAAAPIAIIGFGVRVLPLLFRTGVHLNPTEIPTRCGQPGAMYSMGWDGWAINFPTLKLGRFGAFWSVPKGVE